MEIPNDNEPEYDYKDAVGEGLRIIKPRIPETDREVYCDLKGKTTYQKAVWVLKRCQFTTKSISKLLNRSISAIKRTYRKIK